MRLARVPIQMSGVKVQPVLVGVTTHSGRVSQECNLQGVLDFAALAAIAAGGRDTARCARDTPVSNEAALSHGVLGIQHSC
jgi:hypothetical protein